MCNVGVDCVNRSRPQTVGFWCVSCTINDIAPGFAGVSHDVNRNEEYRGRGLRSGEEHTGESPWLSYVIGNTLFIQNSRMRAINQNSSQ
jgi:hypothetical protein